jgi:hypothetical protein
MPTQGEIHAFAESLVSTKTDMFQASNRDGLDPVAVDPRGYRVESHQLEHSAPHLEMKIDFMTA